MKKISIIGYGNFGEFMAKHLSPYFEIYIYDPKLNPGKLLEKNPSLKVVDLDTSLKNSIIILAIPVQHLENFLQENTDKFNPESTMIDVCSVKMIPVELMTKYLPKSCQIIATHPLFGRNSGKDGIAGLKIVTWPVRISDTDYQRLTTFLEKDLKLIVLEISPEEHDEQMAYVQGATFKIGQMMSKMNLPESELSTKNYEYLLKVKKSVESESPELIQTIFEYNPKLQTDH